MGDSRAGYEVARAERADLAAAVEALGAAFAADPLISFLFDSAGERRDECACEFFRLLMSARLGCSMPVLVAREGARIVGAVMGYDTSRPGWPEPLKERWKRLMAGVPGVVERLGSYEGLADRHMPAEPHYYLGILGVAPAEQGRGIGGALIASFCALSAADPRSTGVYLETASPVNLPLYRRGGFAVTGEGPLATATLWCMFPREARAVNALP
ncbi:MAG: GNAT family N-acetyltransferase [Gammaproteobacteria bacterium]|nr:GNAT family N-acetyltransferase [Gammaproteobacteria bacterium]